MSKMQRCIVCRLDYHHKHQRVSKIIVKSASQLVTLISLGIHFIDCLKIIFIAYSLIALLF